jgi:hypothetical protein
MTPPMDVPWPPMNLVAELTVMSAPHSMGRESAGEGVVLSMMSGRPFACAICARRSMSMMSSFGLPTVSE